MNKEVEYKDEKMYIITEGEENDYRIKINESKTEFTVDGIPIKEIIGFSVRFPKESKTNPSNNFLEDFFEEMKKRKTNIRIDVNLFGMNVSALVEVDYIFGKKIHSSNGELSVLLSIKE